MLLGNFGFGILFPLVMLAVWVAVIVAIFQIRSATRDTAEKLDAICKLMVDREINKHDKT
jgi:uncharacterized membrane protein